MHLGNENKYKFILHFARFALTLPQEIKPKPKMKKIFISLIILLACGSMALAQTTKEERIKYIRKCYAEAKKKVDNNGKNGKSPKDIRVTFNRLEDEDIPLYDTEQLNFFFEEKIVDGLATKQPPYLIVENWGNHGHIRYREVLLDPKNHQVIFCYMRGETDGGFVVESRYYYDAKGQCIEKKHNTENTWTTAESEKENAEYYVRIYNMLTFNGYFTPLDSNTPKKSVTPKAERLKYIRSLYAKAKERLAANDKSEMPNDLHITIHDLGDNQPPRMSETKIYFDKEGIYFICRTSKSMQLNGYDEYLIDPKAKNLVFSYSRGEEEGQVYEWRYYFDENGNCIETKVKNTDETDDGFYDKRAAKDFQAIFDVLNSEE